MGNVGRAPFCRPSRRPRSCCAQHSYRMGSASSSCAWRRRCDPRTSQLQHQHSHGDCSTKLPCTLTRQCRCTHTRQAWAPVVVEDGKHSSLSWTCRSRGHQGSAHRKRGCRGAHVGHLVAHARVVVHHLQSVHRTRNKSMHSLPEALQTLRVFVDPAPRLPLPTLSVTLAGTANRVP